MILGNSKAGKTTSIRTLEPTKTIVFSPLNKGLPFDGSMKTYTIYDKTKNPTGNVIRGFNSAVICQWLKHISANMPHITVCVIDDNTFVTAKTLDARRNEKAFDKYVDLAHDFLELAEVANSLRDDLNVYILHHVVESGDNILEPRKIKAATFGKFIDERLHGIESQFEIVYLAVKIVDDKNQIHYKFKTRDSASTCGTPMNMWEDELIDNDLQMIDQRTRCYYSGDCDPKEESVPVKK